MSGAFGFLQFSDAKLTMQGDQIAFTPSQGMADVIFKDHSRTPILVPRPAGYDAVNGYTYSMDYVAFATDASGGSMLGARIADNVLHVYASVSASIHLWGAPWPKPDGYIYLDRLDLDIQIGTDPIKQSGLQYFGTAVYAKEYRMDMGRA